MTRFTAFITKYALTEGVQEVEVEDCSPDMVRATMIPHGVCDFHKPYWHRTREDAIEQAEKMRDSKIASAKKQIARLEKLVF